MRIGFRLNQKLLIFVHHFFIGISLKTLNLSFHFSKPEMICSRRERTYYVSVMSQMHRMKISPKEREKIYIYTYKKLGIGF